MSRLSDVPNNVLYNPNTSLGELEPYVFVRKTDYGCFFEFWHVSEHEIFQLEEGQGKVIGRQEHGPWFILTIFRWRVIYYRKLEAESEIKRLQELKEILFDE